MTYLHLISLTTKLIYYSPLSFTIKILDKEIPLSLKSIIKSVKPVSNNNQEALCFGVEFTELNPEQIFALRNLIYQEIVEHPEYVV